MAAEEHEENKGGDKIEIHQAFLAGDDACDAGQVGDDESERDGQVDVRSAGLRSTQGAADKDGAAGKHRQRGRCERDETKQRSKFEIVRHAEVVRQRKSHRVESKGTAKTKAAGERIGLGRVGLIRIRRAHDVAEAGKFACESW